MPATCPGEITIEKTPKYFIAKRTPERIHKMNPDTKLIVVVRDPVTRALSDYAQNASKRPRMPSFEEMAFISRDQGSAIVNQSWHAISIGLYHKHVKRWLKYFPLKQMHFVNGERLITNPVEEANLVEDFLGLERAIGPNNFFTVRRSGKSFPCPRKHPKQPKCLGSTKGRKHPVIPGHLLRTLYSFYETPNLLFYRLVRRDFSWQ
ncbi:unnamed protein product [Soboliphyme baturini]|uniref:Sulfotransfer_1 domain-containing protein n=1 Tax=Soboliphyme baturini TaxID=241478 RepID=A0A183IUP7_9BILA|nr:unnamed protein product [Soboliphyme baturini]